MCNRSSCSTGLMRLGCYILCERCLLEPLVRRKYLQRSIYFSADTYRLGELQLLPVGLFTRGGSCILTMPSLRIQSERLLPIKSCKTVGITHCRQVVNAGFAAVTENRSSKTYKAHRAGTPRYLKGHLTEYIFRTRRCSLDFEDANARSK